MNLELAVPEGFRVEQDKDASDIGNKFRITYRPDAQLYDGHGRSATPRLLMNLPCNQEGAMWNAVTPLAANCQDQFCGFPGSNTPRQAGNVDNAGMRAVQGLAPVRQACPSKSTALQSRTTSPESLPQRWTKRTAVPQQDPRDRGSLLLSSDYNQSRPWSSTTRSQGFQGQALVGGPRPATVEGRLSDTNPNGQTMFANVGQGFEFEASADPCPERTLLRQVRVPETPMTYGTPPPPPPPGPRQWANECGSHGQPPGSGPFMRVECPLPWGHRLFALPFAKPIRSSTPEDAPPREDNPTSFFNNLMDMSFFLFVWSLCVATSQLIKVFMMSPGSSPTDTQFFDDDYNLGSLPPGD